MQTLTVREAETQLNQLIQQAQTTHQSVFLTSEETTAPVAVLTPLFADQSDGAQTVDYRWDMLESILQMWQQYRDEPEASADYAQLFQSQLRLLSPIDPNQNPSFKALVMLLRLAVRQLPTPPVMTQLDALRYGLDALKSGDLNSESLSKVDQMLLNSGIDARADLEDEELLKHYVEAS